MRLVVHCLMLLFATMRAHAADLDIPYQTFTLDNGLRVVVHEDHKAPVVALGVWYHVGSKDEPEGQTGFAHLFEHLMFNGSEHHDGEYFAPLEDVGATEVNGTTWLDRTNYYQTVPTPALELALFLESDRMGHLLGAVTKEKLDNQRDVVKNEKRQGDNQPYGLAEYRLQEGLFPVGHPYHHSTIGSMADLDAASLDDVHQWFRGYYGPNNAVLALAGDIDLATARALVTRYFADIPPGPPVTRMTAWVPERSDNIREVMQDRVANPRITRAWPVPGRTSPEIANLRLAADVLASGKASRLVHDLVRARQLATGVSASVELHELASIFEIVVDVRPGVDPALVEQRLDTLLAGFLAKGPVAAEVDIAKTGIRANATRSLEKVGGSGGKAATLAQGLLYAGDPGYFRRSLDAVEKAKPEEIRATAARWLGKGYYQLAVLPYGAPVAKGEGVDRSALPEVVAVPELDFSKPERGRLRNGMEVVFVPRHGVPLVEIAIQFDAGFAADQGGKLGLADLALDMLDEGSKKHSAVEMSNEKLRLGAEIYSQSTLDTSLLMLSALKDNLAASIKLFAELVRIPAFAEDELARLQKNQIAGIAQEKSRPVSLALRLLPPLIYGGDHAYGVPFTGTGTEEGVGSVTRDDLIAFQKSWLRPDNAKLFVVGDATLDEVVRLLDAAFGDWTPDKDARRGEKNLAAVNLPDHGRVLLVDRPGSEQALILAAHVAPPVGAEDDIAIATMNDILGGKFTARINTNLREEKGWAYGAYSLLWRVRGQRPFLVYAPVQTDRTADAMVELKRELVEYRSTRPPSADELARVVKNNVRSLPGEFETANAVLAALVENDRFGRPDDFQSRLTARYQALDAGSIAALAQRVIHPEQLIWVVVGDVAKIEGELRARGIGPVEIITVD